VSWTSSVRPAASRAAEIDRLCDRFEEEWHGGNLRPIAEHVAEADPALRDALAEELALLAAELQGLGQAQVPGVSGMRGAVLRALASCATFAHLSPQALTALANRLLRQEVAAGQAVLVQGAPCPGLQIVLSGRLAIELEESSGSRRHLDWAVPGTVVGEMGLLTGRPCTAHVRAEDATDLLVLPAAAFAELREEFPEVELALAQVVGDRLGEREFDGLCGKRIGDFLLKRCLGRGGMGVVYEARRDDGGGDVALKMLRHGLADDPRAVARFRREAELLRGLRHPGIVGVADLFIECRTLFLAMELCPGIDLRRVLSDRGGLPPDTARRVLGQVASALRHAHGQGVVHLDIKPANVLVTTDGQLKLADFGLAALLGEECGPAGLVGTPRYMPPEQLAGGSVGPASDWYAFGCMGYELLAGRPRFDDEDLVALAVNKAAWQLPTETGWAHRDPEIAAVVFAALHPLPEHRRLDLEAVAKWAGPVPELAPRNRPA
jgi:CRP-like cAMP-binding protein